MAKRANWEKAERTPSGTASGHPKGLQVERQKRKQERTHRKEESKLHKRTHGTDKSAAPCECFFSRMTKGLARQWSALWECYMSERLKGAEVQM